VHRGILQGAIGLAVSLLFGWLALRRCRSTSSAARIAGADYAGSSRDSPRRLAVACGHALAVPVRGEDRRSVTPAVAFWTVVIGLCFNSLLPARRR
jgi:hypothetical protein